MTYRIQGLDPEYFTPLFGMSDEELSALRAKRLMADAPRGFPCRVSLQDAEAGETLLLLNYCSHAVASPYHTTYAIYFSQSAALANPHFAAADTAAPQPIYRPDRSTPPTPPLIAGHRSPNSRTE